jgi:biotin operon repressor
MIMSGTLGQTDTPLSKQESYRQILSCIGKGAKNSISLNRLIALTGFENRILRRHIEKLRRSGIVIVSGENGGYYFPESPDELLQYINRETKRARSLFYTLRAARQLYKTMGANIAANNVYKFPVEIKG